MLQVNYLDDGDLQQGIVGLFDGVPFEEGRVTLASGEWVIEPEGPSRYRQDRRTVLRKVGLIHEDHYYDVILRNLSKTGARITGLAGVPVGTDVVLDLGHGQLVVSKVVNATENSQGLKFETSMISDGSGGFMTRHRISPYSLAEAGIPLAGGHSIDAPEPIFGLAVTGVVEKRHLKRKWKAHITFEDYKSQDRVSIHAPRRQSLSLL